MLKYLSFTNFHFAPTSHQCQNKTNYINLDLAGLEKNTKRKTNLLKEFTNNIYGVESLNKSEPPQAKQKNYSMSVDQKEEMKNRDKAREMELMAGYTIGMPDYKEPEIKVE